MTLTDSFKKLLNVSGDLQTRTNVSFQSSAFARSFAASGGQAAIDADTRTATQRFLANTPEFIQSGQSTQNIINQLKFNTVLQNLPQLNFGNIQTLFGNQQDIISGVTDAFKQITPAEPGAGPVLPPIPKDTGTDGLLNSITAALSGISQTGILIGVGLLAVLLLKK